MQTNRYPTRCHTCRRYTRAGEGYLTAKLYTSEGGYKHVVQCNDCKHIPACNGSIKIDDPIRTDPEFIAYCELANRVTGRA